MRRVTLHIDRVVLRGVQVDDRKSFADGLQAELARAFRGDVTLASQPPPARIHLQHGAGAGSVGKTLARGIAGVLKR